MNAWKNGTNGANGNGEGGSESGGSESGNVELLIVAGKGGVGKTTVAASLARNAADAGVDVLVIDVEGKRGIASAFRATSLGYAEVELSPADPGLGRGRIVGRTVTPDDALVEWLGDHGLARLAKRMVSTGLVDVIATATPGIRDLLVLAKVKQLVNTHTNGLVILDTPASGHAITFLQSPSALVSAVKSGPIRRQADDVLALLQDANRCQVILVTLPEETPINEVRETAFALEDRVGIALGPIVVNGLLPALPAYCDLPNDPIGLEIVRTLSFLETRVNGQRHQVQRLSQTLPLPQLHLPLLAASPFGPEHLAELSPHLDVSIPPKLPTEENDPAPSWAQASFDRSLTVFGDVSTDTPTVVAHALKDRRVILCCGPGGVGKTTTAAAIALAAAQQGKRAVVVTIDPARRLADALGLSALTNRPSRVQADDLPGELWAMMLDTKATFDDLVRANARTDEQANRILDNAFYKNISSAMGGTQEYMATEKLYELVNQPISNEGDMLLPFDVVVVDTPPTRNALDFIAAPERLTRLLDNTVFRALMAPARGGFRVMGLASQAVLKAVGKIIGGEVLADAVAFFQAFEGMEDGFRRRAQDVLQLLQNDATAWVLISAPTVEAVEEGTAFADAIAKRGIAVAAIIANRVEGEVDVDVVAPPANARAKSRVIAVDAMRYVEGVQERAIAHRHALEPLLARDVPFVLVPQQAVDVHDRTSLAAIATHIMYVAI